jgi:hypothetical protein
MVCASQIGNFNQNGIGNTQTFITNIFNVVMRRLAAVPGATQPRVLPTQPALVGTAQQHALSQQPASQAASINRGLTPVCGGF